MCIDKGININELLSELRFAEEIESEGNPFKEWELEDLIDYIVGHHHQYVKSSIPRITQLLQIIIGKHGTKYPQLQQILKLFTKLGDELILHMMREEKIVFPYMQKLIQGKKSNTKFVLPVIGSFESVRIPIEAMEREHVSAGSLTNELKQLCNNYKTPEDACQTFEVTYDELREFEEDLHMHIHLENNILFPGAILLEGKLNSPKFKN